MNINWFGLRDVLLVGLLAGVVLTGVFAIGVRLLAGPAGHGSTAGVRTAAASLCFAVCAAGAAYGLSLLTRK
jgi:hypothetical protein